MVDQDLRLPFLHSNDLQRPIFMPFQLMLDRVVGVAAQPLPPDNQGLYSDDEAFIEKALQLGLRGYRIQDGTVGSALAYLMPEALGVIDKGREWTVGFDPARHASVKYAGSAFTASSEAPEVNNDTLSIYESLAKLWNGTAPLAGFQRAAEQVRQNAAAAPAAEPAPAAAPAAAPAPAGVEERKESDT